MIDQNAQVTRYAITALVSTVIMAVWTKRRLNQKMLDRSRAAGKVTDEQTTSVKLYRRLMYLWFFDPNRRSGLIGPLTNPVMVKEFRCRKFGRANWIARLFAICLVIALGLMLLTASSTINQGPEVLSGMMVVLQYSLVILLTPSLASSLISGERESGGWKLLQMTPLSPIQIVLGKLLSVMGTLLMVMVATLPGYVVILLININMLPTVITVLQSLLIMALFAMLLSAALSSIFSRTAAATAAAYTILVGVCAGSMVFWLGRGSPFSHEMVERVLTINPVAAALSITGTPGFAQYNLVPANWWIMLAGSFVCLVVLIVRTWQLSRPS
jgi:ABC-type transport system involved in multi-copper enzyme maturation permease subunit